MSRSSGKGFWLNESGATAALYALALPALVAVTGIGFDYARLASLHSEMQNAADQAALAGVTQLDGKPGACTRSAAAARTLIANQTRFANDGEDAAITWDGDGEEACDALGVVRFWQDIGATQPATDEGSAKFLQIVLGDRRANYALTPVVGAFYGDVSASAMAGLNSAVCRAAVLFICNRDDSDPGFTVGNYVGKGVNVTKEGKNGNWGFVGPDPSNPTLRRTLGLDAPPDSCYSVGGDLSTSPGNDANNQVVAAFNTRFDLTNGCPVNGGCSPSANTTKDVVATGANNCTWQEASNPYAPLTNNTYAAGGWALPNAMGYPRDICHAASASGAGCAGSLPDKAVVGDGVWDIDAYFRVNYGISDWETNSSLAELGRSGPGGRPLRYDVYKWEIDHAGDTLGTGTVLGTRSFGSGGNMRHARGRPANFPSGPSCTGNSGIVPGASSIDRRMITLAVVPKASCPKGRAEVPVQKWVDAFLIEPMFDRNNTYKTAGGTSAKEIYVEVVRETPMGGQAENPVRRDVPYLVR